MSPLTCQNISRHELIGLQVVVESKLNFKRRRVKGTIVDETKNMIIVFDGVKKRRIPKKIAIFHLNLPNNSTVVLKGKNIIGRPIHRIKKFRRNQN